jgi:hypothetical protein
MLNIIHKAFILSVVMLIVFMLSVVAPVKLLHSDKLMLMPYLQTLDEAKLIDRDKHSSLFCRKHQSL